MLFCTGFEVFNPLTLNDSQIAFFKKYSYLPQLEMFLRIIHIRIKLTNTKNPKKV